MNIGNPNLLSIEPLERIYSAPLNDFQIKYQQLKEKDDRLFQEEENEIQESRKKFRKNYDKLTKVSCIFSFLLSSAYRMTTVSVKAMPKEISGSVEFFGKILLVSLVVSAAVYGVFKLSFYEDDKKNIDVMTRRELRTREKLSLLESRMYEVERKSLCFGEVSLSPNSKLKNSMMSSQIENGKPSEKTLGFPKYQDDSKIH